MEVAAAIIRWRFYDARGSFFVRNVVRSTGGKFFNGAFTQLKNWYLGTAISNIQRHVNPHPANVDNMARSYQC